MASSLKAGVIGAGVFGGYHAGHYARLEGVSLAGVYDVDPARAAALAERFGGVAFASEAELLAAVDVVSVTTPAVDHARPTLAALRLARSVYVEKPLATALEDADRIVAEARSQNVVVACGFLERAGFAAMGLYDIPEAPRLMEAVRLGEPSARNQDVSVVVDLMIHDLDLALNLTSAEPLAVEARSGARVNELLDEVEAEIDFDDGFIARIHASRIAPARRRTMRLVYPSGEITVDFVTRAFTNTTPFKLDERYEETPMGRDRLGASLERFLAAVRGEVPAPFADGRDGVRALDLALAVEQAAGE